MRCLILPIWSLSRFHPCFTPTHHRLIEPFTCLLIWTGSQVSIMRWLFVPSGPSSGLQSPNLFDLSHGNNCGTCSVQRDGVKKGGITRPRFRRFCNYKALRTSCTSGSQLEPSRNSADGNAYLPSPFIPLVVAGATGVELEFSLLQPSTFRAKPRTDRRPQEVSRG